MCERIVSTATMAAGTTGSASPSPVAPTPTSPTPIPVPRRNYLKEYFSAPAHDLDIFSPATAAMSDEKIEELQKAITKAKRTIEDATAQISDINSARYKSSYTPTEYRTICKYNTRNGENIYFDMNTGFRIIEDSVDTSENSTDVVIALDTKKGIIGILAGYVYDEAAIVVKEVSYTISADNIKINRTIIAEYCLSFFDSSLSSCSKPMWMAASDIRNMEYKLYNYPCSEFLNELYGTSRRFKFASGGRWCGHQSLYQAISEARSNVNFELIMKQAPDVVFHSLLWDTDSSKKSTSCTLPELCNLDKDTYREALARGVLAETMSLNKVFNRRTELKKTPAEMFSLMDKCRSYEKDLNFYGISYSVDYYIRYEVGDCKTAQLFGLLAGTYFKNPVLPKYYSFGKLLDYVVQESINQGYSSISTFLGELKDYLQMCESNHVTPSLFSSYLKQTHDIATRNTRLSVSTEDEDKFKARYDSFKKYTHKGYMVIAPSSTEAVKDEGCQLNHCVASYIKRVIDGECLIYFLRTDETKSLITLEIENDTIVQARGLHNRQPDEEELEILKDFAEKRGMTCDY